MPILYPMPTVWQERIAGRMVFFETVGAEKNLGDYESRFIQARDYTFFSEAKRILFPA